ncbi:MAG: molybdopterin-dependent oxidoreductase [Candidatus Hinthialibacter antarcticus]|nr:molybdopterin-dependent oxidoreductase [Candidatus Hinthialibacter antarcticus]
MTKPDQTQSTGVLINRRNMLRLGGGLGVGALLTSVSHSALQEFDIINADPLKEYAYRGWEDLYREQFTWDRVVRSTHSANCTGSCSWKVYVKDGVMLREEQAADYPRISEDLPDYNPRGCQKGACFVEYVYGAQRLKYPLIRTGERGEGKWRRASWDEALEYVAEKVVDNIYNYGPDTNTFFSVIPAMSPVSFSAGSRFAQYVGGVFCSFYDWYCDLPPGEPITWGVQTESCECADWFNSKYIVLWGSNINQTRIPDAHYAWEARYNGAKVVCISPDYNSSAIHCDQYIRVNPGSDAILAMAVCRYLIENDLCDTPYIKEQTDMPLLVRLDTNRFLRASDLGAGDEQAESQFFVWDSKSQKPVALPGCMGSEKKNLLLGEIDPELRGQWTVQLENGESCEVTTVFNQLGVLLKDPIYSLQGAAQHCGIDEQDLQTFFNDFATRKPAMIIHGAGTNHWYHNDLLNRAMILVVALTGNVGKNGGGFNHYVGQERIWPEHGFKTLAFPEGAKKQRFQNMTMWTYCHSKQNDPHLINGKLVEEYILDSVRNGWMPLWPKNDWAALQPEQMHDLPRKPRSLFVWRANYLNQAKGNEAILRSLWKDLDLIVDINYRMDTTALYSDVVLPASSYYEKTDLNSTDCHSYMHPFSKVLDPLYESKTDWDIFGALSKKVAEVVKRKGLQPFQDEELDWERDLTKLYENWTSDGAITTDEDACNHILSNSPETEGMTYHNIQSGPKRFVKIDEEAWNSDIEEGRAYTPFTHQIEKKRPWRTLTGRQQFYIDHPWYLDLEEQLPVHKEPQDDPEFPYYWNTPHGRWSIHSTWRDNRYMLRLQRGLPIVYIHPDDANQKQIKDNDWVRVFNDQGETVVKCKILPGEKKRRLTMYHGWEKFLGFQEGGWQSLTYIKIKPTQLIGHYGHLNFKLNYWGPTGSNRDIKVNMERYDGPIAGFEPSA